MQREVVARRVAEDGIERDVPTVPKAMIVFTEIGEPSQRHQVPEPPSVALFPWCVQLLIVGAESIRPLMMQASALPLCERIVTALSWIQTGMTHRNSSIFMLRSDVWLPVVRNR